MKTVGMVLVALIIAVVLGLAAYFYTGSYPIGADVPHSGAVFWMLEQIRNRTIAVQASGIRVPADLNDPKRIPVGAHHYADMCAVCHLTPGEQPDETARGLNPHPPELARGVSLTPGQIFWVLKHGLKMTGMPAWGHTHTDEQLWDIAAFVIRLPHLTAQQYRQLTSAAGTKTNSNSVSAPAAESQTDTVVIKTVMYTPASLTVARGATVLWKNEDPVPHTVTANDGAFDSGSIAPGQSWRYIANKPGTFAYHCTFHPNMHGVLHVQ